MGLVNLVYIPAESDDIVTQVDDSHFIYIYIYICICCIYINTIYIHTLASAVASTVVAAGQRRPLDGRGRFELRRGSCHHFCHGGLR